MAGPTRGAAHGDSPDDDLDARWAELTERLGELQLPPADEQPAPAPSGGATHEPPRPGPRDHTPDPQTEDEDDPARDLVDGFVEPDPDPLSNAEPVIVVGWAAVFGGLAVMLLCVLAWRGAPGLVWLGAVAGLVLGIGLLLWHMPARRDPDDHDDGAVV